MLARIRARLERKAVEHGIAYPPWIPIAAALGLIGATGAAAAQRDIVSPPQAPLLGVLVIIGVALAWVLAPVWIPWWVDLVTILPASALLLTAPVELAEPLDAMGGVLALMAATVAATSGLARAAVTVVVTIPVTLIAGRPDPLVAPFYVGEIVFGAVIGLMLHWQARALQAERVALAEERERAALAERQRIAHEIHDLVAHSLSVTMLHVTGARRALTEDADIPDAIDALTDAERIGRQAMTDIRRTVGLLTTEPSTTRALPGAADLDDLVAEVRAAGLEVSWRGEGDVDCLPAPVGLALYRGLQESLANVAKHAPGVPAEAELVVGRDDARLEVTNPVPVGVRMGTGGNGLTGMASRAEQLGGTLSSGPDGSRWRVVLRVPVKEDKTPAAAAGDRDEWCRLRRIFP